MRKGFTGWCYLNRPLEYFGIRQYVSSMDVLLMVAVATRAGSESRAPSPASCSPITSTNILHDGPCSHLLYGPTNRRHIERHEVQGARERNWDFFSFIYHIHKDSDLELTMRLSCWKKTPRLYASRFISFKNRKNPKEHIQIRDEDKMFLLVLLLSFT